MNERIKELAEQATDKWVGGEFFDRKKFAELIVRECISIIEPSLEHRRDASWGYLGGLEGVELLDAKVVDLKEHFGVEE